jgi:NAD+--asparagine ADP-ribosyltransferase
MKAVLEFNYPEDETKLRRALNGDKFADALWDVKNKVREHFKYGADPAEVLKVVRELVDVTLLEAGEEA